MLQEQQYSEDPWMNHMMKGEFEEAWKIGDAVLESHAGVPCHHLPRHQQYIWNESSLNGKRVLIRCYHGLGDTIQFIRYARLVKAIAREVIVWAQPPLVSLLQSMQAIDKIVPLHDGSPEVAYDADVEIMELPHLFRTTMATIPSTIPYLRVEFKPLSPENEKLKVGLVWKAGDWDPRRDIPFSFLTPLAGLKNIQLYILQADAKFSGWQEGFGIHPGEFCLYEYAQVVRGLDLLISIDSMPAHLAGALGVPVWTLLHADADWRWMRNRDDSPWYPTMRLFRQEEQGDWIPVIERVIKALERISKKKRTNNNQPV